MACTKGVTTGVHERRGLRLLLVAGPRNWVQTPKIEKYKFGKNLWGVNPQN